MRRRQFLRGTAAASLAGALAAACGDSKQQDQTGATSASSAQRTAGADTPRQGGTLAVLNTDDPIDFDLHQSQNVFTQRVYAPLYNQIVKRDPHDQTKIVGDLASSWQTPDATTLVFTFPADAKWHDGSAFTSEDAAFSLQRIISPPQGTVSPWQNYFSAVDQIQVVDPATLRLNLKRPSAPLLSFLALGFIVIEQKQLIQTKGDAKRDAIGTGPYKFKNYSTGSQVELVKNPDYFRKDVPYLDGITFYIIKDQQATFAQVQSGRLQSATIPPAYVSQAKALDANLHERVGLPYTTALNVQKPVFQDVRVRRAIDLIVDRTQAIQFITQGVGTIAGLFVPQSGWGVTAEQAKALPGNRVPKDQDRTEARQLLAAAGVGSGFEFTMTFRSTSPEFESQALFLRDQLAPFGIKGNIRKVDAATEVALRRQGEVEAFPAVNSWQDLDPDSILNYHYRANGPGNTAKLNDPQLESLMDAETQEVDDSRRHQLVLQVENRIRELVPTVLHYWPTSTIAVSKKVQNYTPGVTQFCNNQLEDVWLRS